MHNSKREISNTGLLIRIDDIAENMNWEIMSKCEKLFEKFNIKPLIGVIPNNKDKELAGYPKINNFWDKVRGWQSSGWEIAMHGFTHIYDSSTNKKDFFGYGGKSEFFGHPLELQKKRVNNGLKIFKNENISIRSFFAPNHTYDLNTFEALRQNGITNVIDGYGLFPYNEFGLNFVPQLFYKEKLLPFGIQSTQMHLNYMDENKFLKFENFIVKNSSKIITLNEALTKLNNGKISRMTRFSVKVILKSLRALKS